MRRRMTHLHCRLKNCRTDQTQFQKPTRINETRKSGKENEKRVFMKTGSFDINPYRLYGYIGLSRIISKVALDQMSNYSIHKLVFSPKTTFQTKISNKISAKIRLIEEFWNKKC